MYDLVADMFAIKFYMFTRTIILVCDSAVSCAMYMGLIALVLPLGFASCYYKHLLVLLISYSTVNCAITYTNTQDAGSYNTRVKFSESHKRSKLISYPEQFHVL